MSDNNEFFNLDDILADFSSYSSNIVNAEQPKEKAPEAAPKKAAPAPADFSYERPAGEGFFTEPAAAKENTDDFSGFNFDSKPLSREIPARPVQPVKRAVQSSGEEEFRIPSSPANAVQRPAPARPARPAAARPQHTEAAPDEATRAIPSVKRRAPQFDPERMGMGGSRASQDSSRTVRAPRAAAPAAERKAPSPKHPVPEKAAKAVSGPGRGISGIISIVCAVLSLFVVSWIFVNVHPDSGTTVGSSLKSKVNMVEKFDNYANNAASDALGELAYIPKIYTIAEDVNVAPKPNPANFGSTTDPQEVMKVIEAASALLGDQEVAFDPNANFIPGAPIQYYRDDTILAIAWKEDNSGKCCSCAEVKIAHGSQIRRKVAGDTYSVGKRYYASDMAKECNSVVAINGDFYDFRPIGITVFQRELFRFNPGKLDSCHINSSGDFIFTYADELTDEESTRQFIKDNDIVFSLSFGPILIDNGEFRPIGGYPIGEVNTTYSRSAIGMLDKLHYMLMTVNYDVGYTTAATLNEIGRYMEGKGCQKAYALDGGQTSVLMMNGELVNHVDYGNERTMSDIIYFATAIPEEEAVK